ncbi:hypothetical protein OS493_023288 [Desmophyllum pertusum]|uniref:Uncharacterized protein n=1 Tax=Desmophyllum pertusum TaxID=174260 RepID=A0A9X0CE45_9CNID|nr:hypothetical protein OS493_023288 [Desmophyllum pertusum]
MEGSHYYDLDIKYDFKVCEGAKYCYNCGAGEDSFQNDPERATIEHYFHLGYKYDVIISFMRSQHDICMDLRTLKRRLVKYNLSRKETWRDEEEVTSLIKEEMQDLDACRVTGKCGMCLKLSTMYMSHGVWLQNSCMILIRRQAV